MEQPFTEIAHGAEERTEHLASSEATVPSESAETTPARVYVPKVPYPVPPRHQMDHISAEQLAGFNKMVRRLSKELAFEDARQIRPLFMFFKNCRETQEEIKALYTREMSTPALKVLPKVDDPGKFYFPCSIAGVEFKEALCDSGSSVNLVTKAIIDKLGIVDVELALVTMAFANSSTIIPYGTIRNFPVQVGDCMLHTEFQVVKMSKDHEMPLIFGRAFMATVKPIIDMSNKRVSFSNINKKVFYEAVPTRILTLHASCISVISGAMLKVDPISEAMLKVVPKREPGEKSQIKKVLDGDPSKKLSGNIRVKEKVEKKRVKGDPTMTLIPRMCDEESIEYEVKCKGILTHELKEKGEAVVKGLLSRVLKLNMSDCGACFGTSPHAQPD
ncbi:hypothetical protein N665_0047s0016 [Sinapis alba]|nr:hypothetical protein N665_0047s0016 [Sinapis alba]